MLSKTFPHRAQLLEPFLRVVSFAFQNNERTREFVAHLGAAAFEFFLFPAQLLEFALLFFDLVLLTFELEQLVLRLLDLGIEMFRRQRLLFAQFQHLFDRSNFFRHVKLLQTLLTSRILAADGTLVRALENSRDFRPEHAKILELGVWDLELPR